MLDAAAEVSATIVQLVGVGGWSAELCLQELATRCISATPLLPLAAILLHPRSRSLAQTL